MFAKLFGRPKKDFLKMLQQQSEKTEEGLKALYEFISNSSEETAKKVSQCEQEADEIRRILIEDLNKSFVTPFDREDIFSLSRAIDDIIDYAKTTAEEILLFEIEPDIHIKKIVECLWKASSELLYALKTIKTHPGVCSQHIVKVKKIENLIERKYREALVELFKGEDVIKILKMREIYRHLSNAADRGDEAANIVAGILIKIH